MRKTINHDMSSKWVTEDGTLEVLLPPYNPETQIPWANEAAIRAYVYANLKSPHFMSPALSDAERQALSDANAITSNTARAKQGLLDTDWCENASVRNTSVHPHLTNTAEFDTYRLALRSIIVNKTVEVTEWPTQPTSIWSQE